jgi:hypothetical protein
MAPMREPGRDDDLALRQRTPVIEGDKFGDKVRLPPDRPYLELFRGKRLVTSAALKRYARRFVDNSVALAGPGIPCPDVLGPNILRPKGDHDQPCPTRPFP